MRAGPVQSKGVAWWSPWFERLPSTSRRGLTARPWLRRLAAGQDRDDVVAALTPGVVRCRGSGQGEAVASLRRSGQRKRRPKGEKSKLWVTGLTGFVARLQYVAFTGLDAGRQGGRKHGRGVCSSPSWRARSSVEVNRGSNARWRAAPGRAARQRARQGATAAWAQRRDDLHGVVDLRGVGGEAEKTGRQGGGWERELGWEAAGRGLL